MEGGALGESALSPSGQASARHTHGTNVRRWDCGTKLNSRPEATDKRRVCRRLVSTAAERRQRRTSSTSWG
jgi:hypothetical protein